MEDILRIGAADQRDRIAAGRLTAVALMEATLERIEAVNGRLNAVVSARDTGEVMDEARAADAAGPGAALHGLPVAIKDLADAAGLPTSQGSPLFAGQIAASDSIHVARMRAAGAIVIGKTNTPEFGLGSHTYNPVHGATCNAYDASVSCGGSSGGAAVALAHGLVSLADGSDMMGSLRNPAGWNNVYGMRPSWGRVPGEPREDVYLHQLSTNGPMGRSPRDLALLLSVMEGRDARHPQGWPFAPVLAPKGQVDGTRVAWLGDWGGAWPFEEGVLSLCEDALAVFEDLGVAVEALDAPHPREALWEAWTTLRSFAVGASLAPMMEDAEKRARLKSEAIWEAERGLALTAPEIQRASALRSGWYHRALELFERFDAFVLPTAQVWPFALDRDWPDRIGEVAMDSYHRWMEVVVPASLIGLPAVAVPAGFGKNGLPMGLQIVGAPGADQAVLEIAEAWHRATDHVAAHPPPKLSAR